MLFKRIGSVLLCSTLVMAVAGIATASASSPTVPTPARQAVTASMLGMPLQFEENRGQVDAQVKFLARGKVSDMAHADIHSIVGVAEQKRQRQIMHALFPESLINKVIWPLY